MTNSSTNFKIRPYARLLTMLGEQLIKNERIALIEIVKNSYDADASWVKISFENFGENCEISALSKIIIEDDGKGMTEDVIKNHWLNPATPGKKLQKNIHDTTEKGRKIQGEKGIGRFAVLKLGSKAEIITRPSGSNDEWRVDFDFTKYDSDFLTVDGEEKELFLDDLNIAVTKVSKNLLISNQELDFRNNEVRLPQGTRIEISHLKGTWSETKFEEIYRDLSRLQSAFQESLDEPDHASEITKPKNPNNFDFYIFKNGHEHTSSLRQEYKERLDTLLQDYTALKIEDGKFDPSNKTFKFNLNKKPIELKLSDPKISGITLFKKYFKLQKNEEESEAKISVACGPFDFGFYIFDFNAKPPSRLSLNKDDKEIIKDHRIYLYRDGIRVYPYGDPEDDWLRIDALRGTISAGGFLSNDQVVGFINITQKDNPELKDKTNREGLINTGKPHDDFILLIQTLLAYIRSDPYAKYLLNNQNKNVLSVFKEDKVKQKLQEAKMAVKDNAIATALIDSVEKDYLAERSYLVQRAETTEDLAGVGLSVETASHDIQAMMGKAMLTMDSLLKKMQSSVQDISSWITDLTTIRGMMSFIESQLRDIQLLFKSSKQRRRDIRVLDIIDKVKRIYQSLLDKENIHFEVITSGPPLVAKTTDAVLLQVLLNLIDNAIYWLEHSGNTPKRIEIRLDGSSGNLYFSDNGPGIRPDDADFIFEPFFSGKGQEGRGLGLYIARQLLERHEYSIDLTDLKSETFLPGANFIVSFTKEK